MRLNGKKLFEFGPYRLDAQKRQLWRGAEPVPLTAKATEILVILVDRSGDVVSKKELMEELWPDSFVEEANLTQNVFLLRKALGETAQSNSYIATVPGKGYRFVADVQEVTNGDVASASTSALESTPASITIPANPPATAQRQWPKLAAALLVLVIVSAYGVWRWTRPQPQPPAQRVVLAVLPFANLTGDPGQDYFIDGLTAEIIAQLGRLDPQHLGVISRTSVLAYKEGQKQMERIARELGVGYVLEGSVRRDSDRVRVTAELIQVRDQTHLWAREYDRQLTSQLALQGEIAREVADEVHLTLGEHKDNENAHATLPPSGAVEARDLYIKGRYFWSKRTVQGFEHAVDYFQQAITKDPNFAPAYAGLADCYTLMSSYHFVPSKEYIPKARAAALRALQIDGNLGEAHTSLALIAENYDWDWRTAEEEFRRAIELDPNYATGHQWYGEYLMFQGRLPEALAESERARRLDPLSLIIIADHAAILLYASQYDRAIEELRAVLDMEPTFPRACYLLMQTYVQEGRFATALADLGRCRNVDEAPVLWAYQAYVYGRMGQMVQARRSLEKWTVAARRGRGDPTPLLTVVYAAMGRKNDALALLEESYVERDNIMTILKVDHAFDSLRSDPRFQDLMRRVGLIQ